MTQLERARIIRDKVLSFPRDQWTWEGAGSDRHLSLRTAEWNASLTTVFNDCRTKPEATTYLQALVLQSTPAALPNVLDLWLIAQGKVLSVEWDNDTTQVISMRRGPWESELFGLPEYRPKTSRTGSRV